MMKLQPNRMLYKSIGILSLAICPLVAQEEKKMEKPMMEHAEVNHADEGLSKLVAIVGPVGDSNVKGSVTFEKQVDGVLVTADVGGFEPNTKHGFHIHEFGDLGSPDATSAGGHFNPSNHDHALPDKEMRHEGDLGNLSADDEGHATLTIVVKNITLGAGKAGILGRSVIIHANEDDGGQPTGNAGPRIAAGVIGISKDAMTKPDAEMDEKMDAPE